MRRSIVIAVLLLVASACASTDPEVISQPDSTTTTGESTDATTEGPGESVTSSTEPVSSELPDGVIASGTPAPPGATIRVPGFEDLLDVTLVEIVDPATPSLFFEPTAGTRYVGFRLVITNRGTGVWSDSPSNSVSVIADDNTQHSSAFASIEEGPQFVNTTAGPGDFRQGWVVIELPESVDVARVRFTPDSGFAGDTAEWDIAFEPIPSSTEPILIVPDAEVGDTITLETLDGIPISVSVDEVVDPAEAAEFFEPEEGMRLISMKLTLTNQGSSTYDDSVGNIVSVITLEGFSYATTFSETTAGSGFDGSLLLTPGDVRTGWVTFEISETDDVAKVSVALDSGFGPEVGEWQVYEQP